MALEEHVAKLRGGVGVWNAWRRDHPTVKPDLSNADLSNADLSNADLIGTFLTGTFLMGATLIGANLSNAILAGAHLSNATLIGANLINANLSNAYLLGVHFGGADLSHANLTKALLLETAFANVDLSGVVGLDACDHWGPSVIDHRTLQNSDGELPSSFLRGCGLSDWEIEEAKLYNPDLDQEMIAEIVARVRTLRARSSIQVHYLFISYSHADGEFIDFLEPHFDKHGVRYWRDIHDAPAGPLEKIVTQAISQNQTVLLVLSERSVESDWVEFEATKARELEKKLGRSVLCPIALDDSWKSCGWSEVLRTQITKNNILDFHGWQDEGGFRNKFRRLLEGLDLFYKKAS